LTIQPETVLDAALGLMLEEQREVERREAERRLPAPVEEEWL
jgi:hypothetical protein